MIAGTAKGRRLRAPSGLRVRPMEDRIKEALFNILGESVRGARVLDLYCGSGSLGIEALSRGAEAAVLVDSWAQSVAAAQANLQHTGLTERARIYQADVRQWVSRRKSGTPRSEGGFSLIFLDPPFRIDRQDLATVLQDLAGSRLPADEALLILQQPVRNDPIAVSGLAIEDRRVYGDSALIFYRREVGRRSSLRAGDDDD